LSEDELMVFLNEVDIQNPESEEISGNPRGNDYITSEGDYIPGFTNRNITGDERERTREDYYNGSRLHANYTPDTRSQETPNDKESLRIISRNDRVLDIFTKGDANKEIDKNLELKKLAQIMGKARGKLATFAGDIGYKDKLPDIRPEKYINSMNENLEQGIDKVMDLMQFMGLGSAYQDNIRIKNTREMNIFNDAQKQFNKQIAECKADMLYYLSYNEPICTTIAGTIGAVVGAPSRYRTANVMGKELHENPNNFLELDNTKGEEAQDWAKKGYLVYVSYDTGDYVKNKKKGHITVLSPYDVDDNGNKKEVELKPVTLNSGTTIKVGKIIGFSSSVIPKNDKTGYTIAFGINNQYVTGQYSLEKLETLKYFVYKGPSWKPYKPYTTSQRQ
jgi:hypothetical protein